MPSFLALLIVFGVIGSVARKLAAKARAQEAQRIAPAQMSQAAERPRSAQAAPARPAQASAPATKSAAPEPVMGFEGEMDHDKHFESIIEREQQEQDMHAQAQELRTMSIQQLRRAVVMSEVLGKPVSLRRRRI